MIDNEWRIKNVTNITLRHDGDYVLKNRHKIVLTSNSKQYENENKCRQACFNLLFSRCNGNNFILLPKAKREKSES